MNKYLEKLAEIAYLEKEAGKGRIVKKVKDVLTSGEKAQNAEYELAKANRRKKLPSARGETLTAGEKAQNAEYAKAKTNRRVNEDVETSRKARENWSRNEARATAEELRKHKPVTPHSGQTLTAGEKAEDAALKARPAQAAPATPKPAAPRPTPAEAPKPATPAAPAAHVGPPKPTMWQRTQQGAKSLWAKVPKPSHEMPKGHVAPTTQPTRPTPAEAPKPVPAAPATGPTREELVAERNKQGLNRLQEGTPKSTVESPRPTPAETAPASIPAAKGKQPAKAEEKPKGLSEGAKDALKIGGGAVGGALLVSALSKKPKEQTPQTPYY